MINTDTPLKATLREDTGKGFARRMREEGRIPAVCYGNVEKPFNVSVDPKELKELLTGAFGLNAIFALDVEGMDESPVVRVHEIQQDPVRRNIKHVDLFALSPERKLTVRVPLRLTGKPAGVASGGKLRQSHKTVRLVARPADVPAEVVLDVAHLEVGEMARIAEIEVKEGVEILYDHNFGVAQVYLPRGARAAQAAAEEDEKKK